MSIVLFKIFITCFQTDISFVLSSQQENLVFFTIKTRYLTDFAPKYYINSVVNGVENVSIWEETVRHLNNRIKARLSAIREVNEINLHTHMAKKQFQNRTQLFFDMITQAVLSVT